MIMMQTVQIAVLVAAMAIGPGDDLAVVVDDLHSLPETARPHQRYISLRSIPPERWGDAYAATSLALNMLAGLDTGEISPPVPIGGGRIVRFSLTQYSDLNSPESYRRWYVAWEKLASASPHHRIAGEGLDGKGNLVETNVAGGWLAPELAVQATELTGSVNPLVECGWFLTQALEPPGYWDFTGIGDAADMLAKLGIDEQQVIRLGADRAATVKSSKVALGKPRRILSLQGPFGAVIFTKDNRRADAKRDFVRHPLATVVTDQGQAVKVLETEAEEWVAIGKNGLPLFNTTDGQGRRVDAVDADVAIDYQEQSPGFNRLIVAGIRCVVCHEDNGFNPFVDHQPRLVGLGQQLPDARQQQRVNEIYRPGVVERRMQVAQQDIAAASAMATGKPPETAWREATGTLAWLFRVYRYDPVDAEQAARELGIEQGDMAEALDGQQDPYLADLAQGESVGRDQWHTSLHAALLAAESFRQRTAQKANREARIKQ